MPHWRFRWAAAIFFALAVAAGPCAAFRWQEAGNVGVTLDKAYVDLDSIKSVDGLRIASIMTIYPSPRTNKFNILMDRHIQITAVDCGGRRFVGIRTMGYLNDKLAGAGQVTPDWRNKLVSISTDPLSQRLVSMVCSAPLAAAESPTGAALAGSVPSQSKVGSGSGIIVDNDGYVLTNAHVINGCKTIMVKTARASPVLAAIEAIDPKNDLALVKTDAGYGAPAEFRSQSKPPRLGEGIGVIGYPLFGILSNEPKATFGQINSVAGVNNDYTLLQISAPIQPGNSGGPVFDDSGLVVGVIVAEASPMLAAKIGITPENLNFAIRGELAQIFMKAHGVRFSAETSRRRLETDEIAAVGEKSTAQIVCLKP
jgi:S1-C subfamily serine protease